MTQQASSTPAAARAVIASADALKRFASEMFVKAGAPAAQAGVIADVLVWANLRGMDTLSESETRRVKRWMPYGGGI